MADIITGQSGSILRYRIEPSGKAERHDVGHVRWTR